MERIADMSRALVKDHTTPEERFAGLFPNAKGTRREAVGTPVPLRRHSCMRAKRGSSVKTWTALLPSGKTINSLPARRKTLTKTVAAAL